MARIVFVYIQSIAKIYEKKSDCQWLAIVHQQRESAVCFSAEIQLFFSGVCRNCLLSCFLLFRRMPHKAQLWEWITKINMRIKCAQMCANACFSTRFLTRVCAKVVHAFCVCVGRVSLTCTVPSELHQLLTALYAPSLRLSRVPVFWSESLKIAPIVSSRNKIRTCCSVTRLVRCDYLIIRLLFVYPWNYN